LSGNGQLPARDLSVRAELFAVRASGGQIPLKCPSL
jgi:hypothetical protein